jgi:protein-tyrosine phosphatase
MAEVVSRAMAEATVLSDGSSLGQHVELTSGGTGGWHEGEPMDPRTTAALVRAGFPDHPHVAHQVQRRLLPGYDLVVALDRKHQQTLRGLGARTERVMMLRAFDPVAGAAADVPDPYYGDADEFDRCLTMVEAGCRGLVAALAASWEAQHTGD